MTDYRFAMIYLELKIAILKHRIIESSSRSIIHFRSRTLYHSMFLLTSFLTRTILDDARSMWMLWWFHSACKILLNWDVIIHN